METLRPESAHRNPDRSSPSFTDRLIERDWIALRSENLEVMLEGEPSLRTWERIEDPAVPGVVVLAERREDVR